MLESWKDQYGLALQTSLTVKLLSELSSKIAMCVVSSFHYANSRSEIWDLFTSARLGTREDINALGRLKLHICCEVITEPGQDTRFVSDGDNTKIEVIRACRVQRGRPTNYRMGILSEGKRTSNCRKISGKHSTVISFFLLSVKLRKRTGPPIEKDGDRPLCRIPDANGTA